MSFNPYAKEGLYIAGPECFYSRGYSLWYAQRKLAEYYGIPVVLPTSTELKLNHQDLRENAREIFNDLVVQVEKTTAIIADLECFRGTEPDGGTLFEMGWIYSRGGRLYGYSRDSRPRLAKNPLVRIKDNTVIEQNGWIADLYENPFCVDLMGSTTLVEGDFSLAVKRYLDDLDSERRGVRIQYPTFEKRQSKLPAIYVSSAQFRSPDAKFLDKNLKEQGRKLGYEVWTPVDIDVCLDEDPLVRAVSEWKGRMSLVSGCDIFIGDLNNEHGLEPDSDVSFECGAAYGWGKRCIGFMDKLQKMRTRIPNLNGCDWAGNIVENFNFPINLMFSCSCELKEGNLESLFSFMGVGNENK